MSQPIRIAVFASHKGSNFQALHRALSQLEDPPAQISLCVSNNAHPGAFDYANAHGIETLRLSPSKYEDAARYEADLFQALTTHHIHLIVLAGYMRQLPSRVVSHWAGRIVNVHPALLPKYGGQGMYGLNVHRAVLDAGDTETGVTVHLADTEYDTGPILAQERVPVLDGDTPESLADRVLQVEHRLFPKVVLEMAAKLVDDIDATTESIG